MKMCISVDKKSYPLERKIIFMNRKTWIDPNGVIYNSKKEMCKAWHLSPATYDTRRYNGLSSDEALLKDIHYDHLGNMFYNVKEMCEYWGITVKVYDLRKTRKWKLKDILVKPIRTEKEICFDHLGNKFANKKEMANYYGIDESTYYSREKFGWDVKKILTTPIKVFEYTKECIDFKGNVFENTEQMCNYYNIDKYLFIERINSGWTLENALTLEKQTPDKITYDYLGQEFPSEKSMCKHYNISYTVYRNRRKMGWSKEEALTIPVNSTFSHYEDMVEEYVKSNNIKYKKQYTNAELVYPDTGRRGKFDFSIKNVGLIEVDGEQHFYQVYNWDLEKCKVHDSIKTKYCENNNIPLLRIKYTQVQSGEYKSMIDDFITNPKKYIYNHNTYLSTKEYYKQTYAS